MTKYQKIFLAVLVFAIGVYAFTGAVWQLREGTPLVGKILIAWVVVSVFLVNGLLLSAEGTSPYNDAAREHRKVIVLARALALYANGWDDAGTYAEDILRRLG